MSDNDKVHLHGHPGQREPRSQRETHHEMRRMNLNTASEQEIEDLPMVGPHRARALIEARPFSSWEEVAAVDGIDLGMVDDLRSGGAEL